MRRMKLIVLILLIIFSLSFAFVNYLGASTQSTPTRTWYQDRGVCDSPASNCFDDVVIEPPN